MSTETTDWVGSLLAGGRYEVGAKLGEGGMGFVYRAWDKNLETDVVIKVPRSDVLADSDFAARFAREIRSLVKLAHPHIVRISDVGEHKGMPFAVMQYLPGGSLKDRQPRDRNGTPLPTPPTRLQEWLTAVAEALDFIHAEGYVHRDVKPANILFDAHGNAYLSDFGVAKVLADRKQPGRSASLTGTGLVLGTPEYMAPELIMGEQFDGRSDQYALAVTVYEVLTGRVPFEGPTPSAILVRHTSQAPVPLHQLEPSISTDLSAAVLRGLAKQPPQRFHDCRTFAASVAASIATLHPPRAQSRVPTLEIAHAPRTHAPHSSTEGLACPFCRQICRVPTAAAGKLTRCPHCNKRVQVSPDLTHLEYAIEDNEAALSQAVGERATRGAHRTARLAPAGSDTQPQKLLVPPLLLRRKFHRSPVLGWSAAAVVALAALLGVLGFFHRGRQPGNGEPIIVDEPAEHERTGDHQPATVAAAGSTASPTMPTDSPATTSGTVTTETSNNREQAAANSPTQKANVNNLSATKAPSTTPAKQPATTAPKPLSPPPPELIQRLTETPLPSGPTRELLLCRDIARFAQGILAIVAVTSSDDQKYREAVESIDKTKAPREWTDVDRLLGDYASAIGQICELLGGTPAPSGGTIEEHLRISESYAATLIDHWRGELETTDNAQAREFADELERIETEGNIEKLVARNSLQAICQAHMDACRSLAAAAAFRRSAPQAEIRRILGDALQPGHSDGLEQLRSLLLCELVLWSKLSGIATQGPP